MILTQEEVNQYKKITKWQKDKI